MVALDDLLEIVHKLMDERTQLEADNKKLTRHLETYRRMNEVTREALDADNEGKGTVESTQALKTTNTELLEALKAIKVESDTRERTAHESLAIIHIAAREAIRNAEKQA